MIYDRLLVKYGEIYLKGRNKRLFTDKLNRTIKSKLASLDQLTYEKQFDRLYIILNGINPMDVIKGLNQVFGLHSYSLVAKCESDYDQICQLSLDLMNQDVNKKASFKVVTNRGDKSFPIPSMDVSRKVGGFLLRNTDYLSVDVNHPDIYLKIDIQREGTYISLNELKGLGGLPVGFDGKGLLMISGGIDSPVSGYLMQKRGLYLEAIHFASPPYTNIHAKQKVIDLLKKCALYQPDHLIKLHVIPFTELQKAIYEFCPSNYGITIMRRMMYRISEIVAKKNDAMVLVNGESLGQVASQTLDSMVAINDVTNMPVLRPLVAMDKNEIIKISREIDTYSISIRPHEDCCTIFVPKNPVTKPDLKKIIEFEKKFDYTTYIQDAVDHIEEIMIDSREDLQLVLDEKIDDLF